MIKNKTNISSTLDDYVRKMGVSNIIVYNGAQETASSDWLARFRKYIISDECIELYHQNQNLAERRDRVLKLSFNKLFHETRADTKYW